MMSVAGRCYARTLRLADWVLTRRPSVLLVGIPLLTAFLVFLNQAVLENFPNSGDEYVYLYQGETMARGRLWNRAPGDADVFAFNYIVQEGGRAWGSFPPGWPLVLAAAFALHVPVWLINPALGVLTLLLVARLGARMYGARVGVLSALMTGASSFFLFNAASYFSHTLCGVLLLGAACLAARPDRSRVWIPVGVGFLVGWAVLTRYYTGVVCGTAIVAWLLRGGAARPRTLGLVAAGGLPWPAVLLAYNTALTGSPWELTTTPITYSRWFAPGWWLKGADIWSTHLLRFVLWTPPLLIAAYFFFLRAGAKELRRGPLEWLLVIMAVALYAYFERGGNQYGPRFYYEVFLFVVIFVTANLFREPVFHEKPRSHQVMFGLMAASVAMLPVWVAVHAAIEHEVIDERTDLYRQVQDAGLTEALILIGGRVGSRRSMGARDLTRNGVDHAEPVLFGLARSPEEDCRLFARHPDRRAYLYAWDAEGARGTLTPAACPPAGPARPSMAGSTASPAPERRSAEVPGSRR